ncbi:MAG: XRE family transcriptional regulator [Actinomycetota bacterium]
MAAVARPKNLPDPAAQSGARIRTLREARGLSLRDLAQRSGVSAPMLSQVERRETSPTLAVAAKIAAGLGLSLSQLLRLDEEHHVVVVRRADRQAVRRNGHKIEMLSPSLPGQRAAVSLHTLRAGGRTGDAGDPPMHEPGSRETAVVRTGSLTLIFDKDRYELSEGDAVTFDADLPHHFENPGEIETVFVAVVTTELRTT